MEHKHSVYDADTHFSINPITKVIRNESSRKTTLIQFDHNSERFTFEIPRYVEGHDMSECNKVEVHYLNVDAKTKEEKKGVYTSEDLQISAEDKNIVLCSWLISGNATQLSGTLSFILRYCCVEDTVITYAWNTAIASVNVSTGINASDTVVIDYSDILEKWKAELFNAGYINAATMQNDISVLKSRMDTFAKLSEGSTTGDAELLDGRIDHNSATWANIGNNLRNVGGFAEMLACAVGFKTTKIESPIINGWVDTNGAYISNSSSGDTHKCVQIDVSPGEHYLIYSEYGWSMPDAVAQKEDGGLVRIYNKADSHTINDFNKIITIPDGATKLVVNCMSGNAKPLAVAKITGSISQISVDYIKNALSSIKDNRALIGNNLITSVKIASGLKFGEEFVIENGDTQFSVGECVVEPGKTYQIKAGASFMSNPFVFYDEQGLVVGELLVAPASGYKKYDLELIAPPNAVLLKVGQYGGVHPVVYEVQGYTCAKKWEGLKWACVGDSLTEANARTDKNYHDFVSEETGITVVNMGKGGSGYKRTEDEGNAFYQRIVNVPADADVVTIFGSGNDLRHIDVLGNPTDTGTDTLCGCINTTIDNLYSIYPAIRLGIVSPSPWIYHQPSDNSGMARYADALKEICTLRGIPFLDLFRCSGFRPNDETYRSIVFSKDDGNGVHPNELGHEIIAPKFRAFLESIIM